MPQSTGLLRRSDRDRVIAGVCGGIAEYLGLSSTKVRIVYTLATLFTAFAGCLVYLVIWFVVPTRRF